MKAFAKCVEGTELLGIEKCIDTKVLKQMDMKQLQLLEKILKDVWIKQHS